jgi:hypothetical protein
MNTDLTFITNEENQSLKDRFNVLIKSTSFFDCLVGYFYTSGFHAIYPSLESTEKIRILIGISTNRKTFDLIEKANKAKQQAFDFSHAEVKKEIESLIREEMENSEDNRYVEEGVHKFIEWKTSRKLEIRAYPSQDIHAKLYIMTFKEGDRDIGPRRYLDAGDPTGYQFVQCRGLLVLDSPIGKVAVLPMGMAQVSSVVFVDPQNNNEPILLTEAEKKECKYDYNRMVAMLNKKIKNALVDKTIILDKGAMFSYFQFGGSDCVVVFERQANVDVTAKVGTHYPIRSQYAISNIEKPLETR